MIKNTQVLFCSIMSWSLLYSLALESLECAKLHREETLPSHSDYPLFLLPLVHDDDCIVSKVLEVISARQLLHPQEQRREYFDSMDILRDWRYLKNNCRIEKNRIFTLSNAPTPIIITGKTRDTAKTKEAASKEKEKSNFTFPVEIFSYILVWKRIAAVFRVNSKKCSASVYSSNIRE